MTDVATIRLPEHDSDHIEGNQSCQEDWCSAGEDAYGYPKPCENDDGGLVHAAFGDESANGDFFLYTACDVCGESE